MGNSSCLGAALRARHADAVARGERLTWDEVVAGVIEPMISLRLQPNRDDHALYETLMRVYSAREAEALSNADCGVRNAD